MISTFTVLFDANVFFGARLRSLNLFLAQTGLFRARWTAQIHDEWIAAVIKRRPEMSASSLDRIRQLMDRSVLDCLVEGYEPLVEALSLPDPNDRHVLAAAITARASVIVTFDQSDFPDDRLAAFGIHARHPDEFLMDLESIDPGAFVDAVRQDIEHYKSPPLDIDTYVRDLVKAGVPMAAAHIEKLKILLTS